MRIGFRKTLTTVKSLIREWWGSPSKRLGIALILSVFLTTESNAQSEAEIKKLADAIALMEGEILAGGDPIRQSRVMTHYHKRFDESYDSIWVHILENNINDVIPTGLFILADRMTTASSEKALFWYAVAQIRARYDGLRCADKTAAQGVLYLPEIAKRVSRLAKNQPEMFSKQGKRALQWRELFLGRLEPSWICIHGIKAFSGASPENYTDTREWPKLQAELLATYDEYFDKLAMSDEDPIPWVAQRPAVTQVAISSRFTGIGWLYAGTLVFVMNEMGPGKYGTLMKWSPGSEVEKIHDLPTMNWCAGNGQISFEMQSVEDHANNKFFSEFLSLRYGESGRAVLDAEREFVWASQAVGSSGMYSQRNTRLVQSPFDCRWEYPDQLVSRYFETADEFGGSTVMPLRPGDGYLVMAFGEGEDKQTEENGIAYFPNQNAEPIVFPIKNRGIERQCIRYFDYAKAYSISVCAPDRPQLAEFKDRGCVPSWWFDPETRKLEEVCTKVNAVDESYAVVTPSRVSPLKIVYSRETARGRKIGGIYSQGAEGKATKIYEGWLEEYAVSPDGCRIAVLKRPVERNEVVRSKRAIDVIDLCGGTL